MEERLSYREQLAGRCKHFNGVQNDACEAGVRYVDVRPKGAKLPCRVHKRGEELPPCERRCFPTEAEVDAEIAEADAELAAWKAKVGAGICPECSGQLEPLRQNGRCTYGACGHRLGQGTPASIRAFAATN
jgi:hypothetical protein